MTGVDPKAILSGLLDADADAAGQLPAALPSLDRRVEIYLRAIHGPGHQISEQERTSARARLLEEMTNSLLNAADAAPASAAAPNSLRVVWSGAAASIAGIAQRLRGALADGVRPSLVDSWFSLARPHAIAVPSAALLILACSWAGAWLYTAQSLSRQFAMLAADKARAGYAIDCGQTSWGGSALRVELHCKNQTITVASAEARYVLTANAIVATARLLDPDTMTARIQGPLAITDASRKTLATASGDLHLDRNGNASGTLDVIATADELERFSAFVGGARARSEIGQVAAAHSGPLTDDGSQTGSAAAEVTQPAKQLRATVPVSVVNDGISIGSIAIGRLPRLIGESSDTENGGNSQ